MEITIGFFSAFSLKHERFLFPLFRTAWKFIFSRTTFGVDYLFSNVCMFNVICIFHIFYIFGIFYILYILFYTFYLFLSYYCDEIEKKWSSTSASSLEIKFCRVSMDNETVAVGVDATSATGVRT